MPEAAFARSFLKTVVALFLVILASPVAALACACCAEPGEWYERTARMDDYELAELRNVRFDDKAQLYMTAAGFEDLKGLSVDYESFGLAYSLSPSNALVLKFKGERGQAGSLTLFLPRVATSFGADLHDMPEGSAGPILYKEWRFEGRVGGSGLFRKGLAAGAKFKLIFQGRGNNCTSAADFSHWRLDIKGPRADYAFYGSLRK